MSDLVTQAINDAVIKEAKKHVDIDKLSKAVAAKFTKDFEKSLKTVQLVDESQLQDMMYDQIDWYKLSKSISKDINKVLAESFK